MTRREWLLGQLADHPGGLCGANLVAGMDVREARLTRMLAIRLAGEGVR
jgi:hypothetical protein